MIVSKDADTRSRRVCGGVGLCRERRGCIIGISELKTAVQAMVESWSRSNSVNNHRYLSFSIDYQWARLMCVNECHGLRSMVSCLGLAYSHGGRRNSSNTHLVSVAPVDPQAFNFPFRKSGKVSNRFRRGSLTEPMVLMRNQIENGSQIGRAHV